MTSFETIPPWLRQKLEELWRSNDLERTKNDLSDGLSERDFATLANILHSRGFGEFAPADSAVAIRLMQLFMLTIYHSDGLAYLSPEERRATTSRWASETGFSEPLVRSLISVPLYRDF